MYRLFLFWYDLINDAKKNDTSVMEDIQKKLESMNKNQLLDLRDNVSHFLKVVDFRLNEVG